MKVKIVLAILILSAQIVTKSTNFQVRYFYLDGDSVCHQGSAMNDMIKLKINVDGLETRTRYTWGFITCNQNQLRMKSYELLWPERWNYYDYDTNTTITFNEELQASAVYSILLLKLNTTVQYPSVVDGKPYNCTIVGDGRSQHYGQEPSDEYLPCQYYLKCDKIMKDQQNLVKVR